MSDRETVFLLDGGDISWMCVPTMDSPSVFAGLLGSADRFFVGPVDGSAEMEQDNLCDSLGIETKWHTPNGGCLVVSDVLALKPDGSAHRTLVRHIRCIEGKVKVKAVLRPSFDYGREDPIWVGSVARSRSGLVLKRDSDLHEDSIDGAQVEYHRTLVKGDSAYIALTWGGNKPPENVEEAERLVDETVAHWRGWLANGTIPDHPFGPAIARSALVLKGLCCRNGAIAAAGTTSLPEAPGGTRNWDYRFVWVRDAVKVALAMNKLGFREVADELVRFFAGLPGADVQIMYGLSGQTRLDERTLAHLPGYEGAVPVRVGNDAYMQRQNDVWGHLIELIYQTQQDRLTDQTWHLVLRLVQQALKARGTRDKGIWEVRSAPQRFTTSWVYVWLVFDRAAKLAGKRGDDALKAEWEKIAGQLHEEICDGVSERGVFTAFPGDEALDASCLLIPILGFLPADDPRVVATVHAVAQGLTRDGLLLRYDPKRFGDGLPGEEMAFVITCFWLVEAYVLIGERKLAEEWYARVVQHIGPLGLLAEEIDPVTGRHWGNTPQAFSHLGLINAACALIETARS